MGSSAENKNHVHRTHVPGRVINFWDIFERDAEGPSEMAPESETRRDPATSEKDDNAESC